MSQRIFISSVQREFAKERKALAEYVRKDAILGRFFDVFLFEEVPAQERKFVMVMPRPQSSVKSVDWSVDKTVDWTVDKTVDWTVDKTADGSTNERILNLLVTNPRATQEELARVLGLSVRGIEYAIGTLKKAKRIRKVGGKRFGHWEVIG